MGLVQIQQILAKLYTNTVFREIFFTNPQAIYEEFGVSEEEAQQLEQLASKQVNLFANSLKRKRLGEVRELLPLTQQVLGKDFSGLFWRYSETHLPQGIKKHWEDAITFANFIEKIAQLEGIYPNWIVQLVRYEKVWLQSFELNHRLTVCRFPYAMEQLVQSLRRRDDNPLLLMQPTIAFWFRFKPGGKLKYFVFSLPI